MITINLLLSSFYSFLFLFLCLVRCEDIVVQYDLNLPNNELNNVTTVIKGLNTPIGCELGTYQGNYGLFVTSFSDSNIRFVTLNPTCEQFGTCQSVIVAGSGISGMDDGDFGTATFSDPSRILFISELNVLVVTDRANGYVRYLSFNDRQVRKLSTSGYGLPIVLVANAVSDSFPEMDVKRNGNYLYLSDTRFVYNITGDDGSLRGALDSGVLSTYTALKKWQLLNDYDISSKKIYIASIAIDSRRDMMYIAYTFTRNAIVQMPLQCRSVSDISILSTDGVVYNIPQTYPKPRNGNIFSSPISGYALFTFPMHLVYDSADDILYWTEAYAHLATGSTAGALGALAVRRLKFSTYEVDYYAGNIGTFRAVVGKTVGYKDGPVDQAIFRLPTSLAFYSNVGIWGTGPLMYVCDNGNGALRRVATVVNTKAPTLSPTVSIKPTFSPTVSLHPTTSPTILPTFYPTTQPSGIPTTSFPTSVPTSSHPTVFPTSLPTGIPTSVPSISLAPTVNHAPTNAPTQLDGDCLEILLLDEFGDGWNGLSLVVNHTGYLTPPNSADSTNSPPAKVAPKPKRPQRGDENVYYSSHNYSPSLEANPLIFRVCASLHEDRYHDRGVYSLEISHTHDRSPAKNEWEIVWQIATRSGDYNDWIYADRKTKLEFEFQDDGLFHRLVFDHPAVNPNECVSCKHPPPKKPTIEPNNALTTNSVTDDNGSNNDPPAEPIPHTVSFELSDREGDGWFSSQLSAKFSISDSTKTKLLSYGTLCGQHVHEICVADLVDGDYYYRVGGAGDVNSDEISWSFCGLTGTAQQELSFAIIHGKCIPGHLSNAIDMIGAKEQTTLTIRGEVLLENVFSNELSIAETRIFEEVIAQTLEIDSSEVMILSICETRSGVYCSVNDDDGGNGGPTTHKHKLPITSSSSSSSSSTTAATESTAASKLSSLQSKSHQQQKQQQKQQHNSRLPNHRSLSPTYVLDVVFLVTIVAEKYEKVGSQYHATMNLIESKQETFQSAFKSGVLQASLRNSDHDSLAYVRLQHMQPLKHTDLSYTFVSVTNAPTPLPHTEHQPLEHIILDETLEQTALIATPILFIGFALLVIAVIVIRERWNTNYYLNTNNNDSTLPSTINNNSNEKLNKATTHSSSSSSVFFSSELNRDEDGTGIRTSGRREKDADEHLQNFSHHNQNGQEQEELTLELRSDFSHIPSHLSSRSRYRSSEGVEVTGQRNNGGGRLSDNEILPMLNIRATDNPTTLRDNGSLQFDMPISTSKREAQSPV